jgi:hypothetical protein
MGGVGMGSTRLRRARRRRLVVAGVVRSVLSLPRHARAENADEGGFWKDFGLGVGAVVTNIVYMPAKFVWATIGAVVGGLAYGLTLGSTETANAIWEPTLGGNYVLTPSMLAGEEKFSFSGDAETQPPTLSPEEAAKDPHLQEYDGQWTQ